MLVLLSTVLYLGMVLSPKAVIAIMATDIPKIPSIEIDAISSRIMLPSTLQRQNSDIASSGRPLRAYPHIIEVQIIELSHSKGQR